MSTLNQPNESAPVLSARVFWIFFTLIAIVGTSIRVTDSAAWRRTGPDELMYRRYVNMMDGYQGPVGVFPSDERTARTGNGGLIAYSAKIENTGAMAMPEMVDFYIETQNNPDVLCELPPTRFLYIYTSWLWKRVQFGDAPSLAPGLVGKPGSGDDYSKDADHVDPALTSLHRVAAFFPSSSCSPAGCARGASSGAERGLPCLG